MRTIPRKLPADWRPGNYRARCVVCMAPYYRDRMVRRPDGLLVCLATCADGREAYELNRLQAEAGAEVASRRTRRRGGIYD